MNELSLSAASLWADAKAADGPRNTESVTTNNMSLLNRNSFIFRFPSRLCLDDDEGFCSSTNNVLSGLTCCSSSKVPGGDIYFVA